MGREGLWFVSGSTPRRDNKRRTWIDLSKNPRVSLPCLVPLSKAPYSPNICSPSACIVEVRGLGEPAHLHHRGSISAGESCYLIGPRAKEAALELPQGLERCPDGARD
ncbi:unnamed protein product [Pleuronectes platessa]|uniref:Uncharacterized protein n=1 Tax=Pleuronectes platessa TaxID=8262 RepID=A0A9N7VDA1_PLEPL|nr:unnamed protein product [Pleuronectes platessa]